MAYYGNARRGADLVTRVELLHYGRRGVYVRGLQQVMDIIT